MEHLSKLSDEAVKGPKPRDGLMRKLWRSFRPPMGGNRRSIRGK